MNDRKKIRRSTAGMASSCLRLARWSVSGSLSMTVRGVIAEVEVEDRKSGQGQGWQASTNTLGL